MIMQASSLTDRVAQVLIDRIRQGDYPVGSKLPAGRLLAHEFQVSAAVIREATERLRTKGLVRSRQGAGCTVVASTSDDGFQLALPDTIDRLALRHIYELRVEVEGGAAALAAVNARSGDIQAMEQALSALRDALAHPDQALEWDLQFHHRLAQATHNPHYAQLLHYLNDQWRQSVGAARLHTLALDRSAPGDSSRRSLSAHVHEEHIAVLKAIKARQPALARQCARTHLANACSRLGLELTITEL